VRKYDGQRNIYYSVNPTRKVMSKKAKKADIAAVEYLLADLDPNEGESASDGKARYLAQLNGTFEPKPTAIVDSGNGIQCLWRLEKRIELPSEAADELIADVEARTAAVMLRLGGKPGTQNVDRILRLPGTTNLPNKKKRDTGRVACPTALVAFNGTSYPLDAFVPDTAGPSKQPEPKRSTIDINALPLSDRIKNLIRGIDDPEHHYPSRSERVMAVLVAMAGAGCSDEQMAAVMFDRALPIGEHVREQPNLGRYFTRQLKEARKKAGDTTGQQEPPKFKLHMQDVLKSAADLRTKTFDPLRWIVPKYLPEGLTVLGGRPKVGKSWMALDAAIAVSIGGLCMGEECEQGNVLALMLEDSDRRLQRRLTTMLGAYKEEWPQRLTYATAWPRLNEGGLDWIREWISQVTKPRLIIIDILERVRQRVVGKDKSHYSADYEALAVLQELSTEAQLSTLVLHHQRKLGAEDLIDTLSGTLGLGGAVDAVLILQTDQFGKFLYGRGRDLEEFSISIKQGLQCRWQVLGPRVGVSETPERRSILEALARTGRPMTVKEIADAIGGKPANVKMLLAKLHMDGEIERVQRGIYKLPPSQGDLKLGDGF
jgi:AAA domain/Helix-turn-helix domain